MSVTSNSPAGAICPLIMRPACLLLLVLAGCSSSVNSEHVVEDDSGRTVHLPAQVDRIAPIAPSITELLFASGAGPKVVGVSFHDDFPPAVDSLPKYSLIPMDFEAIVALDPDLVIASEQVNSPKDADTFAALGIPVYFIAVHALGDVPKALRTLGELLDTSDIAVKRATELEDSLALLSSLTADLTDRPEVLFLIEYATLYAFGKGSYIHNMIDLAGGFSVTGTHATRFPVLTDEFVLEAQPDVIACTFGEPFEDSSLLEYHPTWDILPAVQSGRIYRVTPDFYLGPGPRLVNGAWELAGILHPDIVTYP